MSTQTSWDLLKKGTCKNTPSPAPRRYQRRHLCDGEGTDRLILTWRCLPRNHKSAAWIPYLKKHKELRTHNESPPPPVDRVTVGGEEMGQIAGQEPAGRDSLVVSPRTNWQRLLWRFTQVFFCLFCRNYFPNNGLYSLSYTKIIKSWFWKGQKALFCFQDFFLRRPHKNIFAQMWSYILDCTLFFWMCWDKIKFSAFFLKTSSLERERQKPLFDWIVTTETLLHFSEQWSWWINENRTARKCKRIRYESSAIAAK
jgi:hypothetical protein